MLTGAHQSIAAGPTTTFAAMHIGNIDYEVDDRRMVGHLAFDDC
jgi:hypothetical protein